MNIKEACAVQIDPIVVGEESTVVSEYELSPQEEKSYQSEATLEQGFIRQLQAQAYEYLPIHTEAELIANLRHQLEKLNQMTFSESEWKRFFETAIANKAEGIAEKTFRIQADHVQLLKRDDGSSKNIMLLDKSNIHNNFLQVINQYEVPARQAQEQTGATVANRYDVTILVNGLPLVHVELKRRGMPIREAFNQIDRYQRQSFWAGSGLFDYVQIFVISNGTHTKYYSNTTRRRHIDQQAGRARLKKSSNTFEFTCWWADANNQKIIDLVDFTKTFFAKHSLLGVLTRYCVFTSDRSLLVMRPYQIVATERILQRIQVSTNYRQLGTVKAGGYIWHTTGSGKTLTSFKTAQLATAMPGVEKVLFVVDRKDLDYQTMREYDRFQKGAANSNTSTAVLTRQMQNPEVKIIITTIQKLSRFIQKNQGHQIFDGHVVIIFDECHRSQFGDMNRSIRQSFKNYHLFGFTGTPIFSENAGSGGNPSMRTTEQVFGEKLHTYTIIDAIADGNVLPFKVSYHSTIREDCIEDKKVNAIDKARALHDPRRVDAVVDYILNNYDRLTKRSISYSHKVVRNVAEVSRRRSTASAVKTDMQVRGFNAIFATDSIQAAQDYYRAFKVKQAALNPAERLKVGIIYSYAPNAALAEDEAPNAGLLEEETFNAEDLSPEACEFLQEAINDYNAEFAMNYDTSAEKFEAYYKDLCARIKNRELDLVIVVNMLLTGFDATTLNTLFVDKYLHAHGLIQAYSRTNRILNSVKTYGNIVCFRDLHKQTDEAIALFGNKDARGTVLLRPYREYYDEYTDLVQKLKLDFPLGQSILGEEKQKEFIALYGAILRVTNILSAFDEFTGQAQLSERQEQDYQSRYLDIYDDFKRKRVVDKEDISQDLLFEIELIKQVQINVDYILMMVEQARSKRGDGEDKEILNKMLRAVDASPTLRNKKDLIEAFVAEVSPDKSVADAWDTYIKQAKDRELQQIIREEGLVADKAEEFMERAFRDGQLGEHGTAITAILPRRSLFATSGGHGETKARVLARLQTFFNRFKELLD